MPGTYDSETNTDLVGHRQSRHRSTTGPAPTGRPRARARATISIPRSVIALDPDTGKLKFYHQELPHDAWDFDSAVGEFVMLERDGQKLVVHPNKSGFIFVYDRGNAQGRRTSGGSSQNINFVKDIDPKTGELIGRRDMAEGSHEPTLPGDRRRRQLELRAPTTRRPASTTRSARNGAWTSTS